MICAMSYETNSTRDCSLFIFFVNFPHTSPSDPCATHHEHSSEMPVASLWSLAERRDAELSAGHAVDRAQEKQTPPVVWREQSSLPSRAGTHFALLTQQNIPNTATPPRLSDKGWEVHRHERWPNSWDPIKAERP